MSVQFHLLKVAAVERPIEEATTITFEVPEQLYDTFHYHPGQHLVLQLTIDGKEVRRTYSLNSCPHAMEPLQVTVKRVKDGLASNYINDHLQTGQEIKVMPPQGRFYARIDEKAYKTYFLFAAGSGITPIISLLKSVLHTSPDSVVHLLYGNSNQDTILFKEELEQLQKRFPNRWTLTHTLSKPKVWTTWKQWKGRKGRIDAKAVEDFIAEHPPIAQSAEYYICGPGNMNVQVRKTLLELGIPKDLIHIEQFGGAIEETNTAIPVVANAQLTAHLDGQKYQRSIPEGQTILQVLKAANANPPYSCESGVCATCVAKVVRGKAEMKSCMALEEEEINKGMVLTCQALPVTEEVEVKFE